MIKMNQRYLTLFALILTIFISSSTATFCSNLTSTNDKTTPCFLETVTTTPVVLRTSGNTLVLPCHVARSKRSIVEWWYSDPQKSINIKIYPVFPPVRPTVLRFMTGLTFEAKNLNETDILDSSILLRYVNIDDSGTFRCVVRPWTTDPLTNIQELLSTDDSKLLSLQYQVQVTAPRLCQAGPGTLPCFSAMRTSSPTVIDAYQTTYLQCIVNTFSRPVNVFWVVGNLTTNSLLITDHLATNQYRGDRLRRVFPLSPFDFSLELIVNRTTFERVYSCVIDGATDTETTFFTYIVRTMVSNDIVEEKRKIETTTHVDQEEKRLIAHDALKPSEIDALRQRKKNKNSHVEHSIDPETTSDSEILSSSEETSTSKNNEK